MPDDDVGNGDPMSGNAGLPATHSRSDLDVLILSRSRITDVAGVHRSSVTDLLVSRHWRKATWRPTRRRTFKACANASTSVVFPYLGGAANNTRDCAVPSCIIATDRHGAARPPTRSPPLQPRTAESGPKGSVRARCPRPAGRTSKDSEAVSAARAVRYRIEAASAEAVGPDGVILRTLVGGERYHGLAHLAVVALPARLNESQNEIGPRHGLAHPSVGAEGTPCNTVACVACDRIGIPIVTGTSATVRSDAGPVGHLPYYVPRPMFGFAIRSRKGVWAMTVNARWRLTFRFADGDAYAVAIEDYHRG